MSSQVFTRKSIGWALAFLIMISVLVHDPPPKKDYTINGERIVTNVPDQYNSPIYPHKITHNEGVIFLQQQSSILLIDIKNPEEPMELSRIDLRNDTSFFSIWLSSLYVEKNWLYVGDMNGRFWIVDIHDEYNPYIAGMIRIGNGTLWYYIRSILVRDGYAYLARTSGISILDVRNKENPREIGQLNISASYAAWDLALLGNTAFLANEPFLTFVDVSNRSHPVKLSEYSFDEICFNGISLLGTTLYGYGREGLVMLCVKDINDPKVLWKYDRSHASLGLGMGGIFIHRNHIYIGLDHEVIVFDVTGGTPSRKGSFNGYGFQNFTTDGEFLFARTSDIMFIYRLETTYAYPPALLWWLLRTAVISSLCVLLLVRLNDNVTRRREKRFPGRNKKKWTGTD